MCISSESNEATGGRPAGAATSSSIASTPSSAGHGVREVLVVRELFRWRCAVHADKARNCVVSATAVIYVLHYPHFPRRYAPVDPATHALSSAWPGTRERAP
ncbi:hypothetical protein RW1_094_02410 [Rhodococcus wratislaviensis NBRC 100605]|uniref:Uncharacterized protein n=1 Tax=Rhodococcus wratislaviensis NBRC 100605 TaxID=1219028 RepID=X0RGK7_RHOWR|nr:hypothetical protein RW1_094_02410 [Rhodococcus wratislaviensis NBRC 100605]